MCAVDPDIPTCPSWLLSPFLLDWNKFETKREKGLSLQLQMHVTVV